MYLVFEWEELVGRVIEDNINLLIHFHFAFSNSKFQVIL